MKEVKEVKTNVFFLEVKEVIAPLRKLEDECFFQSFNFQFFNPSTLQFFNSSILQSFIGNCLLPSLGGVREVSISTTYPAS